MAALPLLAVFGLLATYAHAATTARAAALASVTLTAIPQEKVPHGTPVRVAWTISGSTTSVCSLDGRPGRVCTSPQTLTDLGVGRHRLAITARARRGSATVTITWEVVAPPSSAPDAPPAAAPPAPAPPAPAPPAPSAPPAAPAAPAVTPPAEPGPYQVPANAVVVRTSAELTAALAGPSQDIVLADGTYDASTPFSNTNGHRLYAQNLGRATLRAGLVVGGNFGAPTTIVRGITFDVSATAKVLGGAIVHVWGPGGANAKLLDCVFRGNNAIPYGVLALNPSGLVLQRAQFSSFTDVAARISDNTRVAYGNATPVVDTITDVSIDGVSRSAPGSSKGTAEAGLWVGHPVRNDVARIRVRNVSWAGIETVNNSWDTRFSDLDIDMSGPRQAAGVGVYMEHYTRNVVFERFTVRGARTGFNGEWADPATGGKPGAHTVTIRSGHIDSAGTTLSGRQAGIYLDEGSYQTTVTGVTFANQNWAGIGAFRNAGANSFTQNTFRLSSGAVEVSTDHI